jgi:transaldolase
VLNIFQAEDIGCHIITCGNDLISKLNQIGKDPLALSHEAVQIFHRDAVASGLSIRTAKTAA